MFASLIQSDSLCHYGWSETPIPISRYILSKVIYTIVSEGDFFALSYEDICTAVFIHYVFVSVIVLILGCKSFGLVKEGGCIKRIILLVPLFLFCGFTNSADLYKFSRLEN